MTTNAELSRALLTIGSRMVRAGEALAGGDLGLAERVALGDALRDLLPVLRPRVEPKDVGADGCR